MAGAVEGGVGEDSVVVEGLVVVDGDVGAGVHTEVGMAAGVMVVDTIHTTDLGEVLLKKLCFL